MKFLLIIFSIIYLNLSNINCLANETDQNESTLKVGLIVPLTGKDQKIGKSVLNSMRLALSKINDELIEIFPMDNNSNPEKTLLAAKRLENEGIKIVIGPIFHKNLIYLEEIENIIFLSLSNKTKSIPKNVITIGINADSQINTIVNFLKKEKLNKTIVLIPKSSFENELKKALVNSKHKFLNIYSYDVDPGKLTSQIRQITSYKERKENLERRIEILEKSETEINKRKLEDLKKKYTLGEVEFDSVVIADFGENLKSVTTSLSYSDVTAQDVKFIALNQWFDKSLFKEISMQQMFFPSINLTNYLKYKESYFKTYGDYPSEISILSYDIMGLIYYSVRVQKDSIEKYFFNNKKNYIGESGEFSFDNKKINHKLNMYQVVEKKFLEIK